MADAQGPMDALLEAVASEPISASHGRLREEVYARLRNWIIEGRLPAETRLRDREIADAMGVSRTPVREALRRLEDDGLVVTEASRWTKVASVDTAAAGRIYPIVWTLERLAVRQGEFTADRLERMRAANERLRNAIEHQDAVSASEADNDFHRLAVGAASNPELTSILEDLRVALHRIEVSYFGGALAAERSVGEHEQVLTELDRTDLEAAGIAIEDNWRASFERLGIPEAVA